MNRYLDLISIMAQAIDKVLVFNLLGGIVTNKLFIYMHNTIFNKNSCFHFI